MINRFNKLTTILLLIVVGGAILRLWGIHYGLPGIYNSDESLHLINVMYMGATKNLEPFYFLYPTAFHLFLLPFYAAYYFFGLAIGPFKNSVDLAVSYAINPSGLFILGRIISAAFGVATAYIVWLISKQWFSVPSRSVGNSNDVQKDYAGIWATILLMVSFLHAERSHWLLLEAPLAFACTWALYWILKASHCHSKRYTLFAGLITGLAISVKYNAGFLVLPLIAGFLFQLNRTNVMTTLVLILITTIACLTGFFIGTPSLLWAGQKFLNVFQYQRAVMQTGWIGQTSNAGFLWPFVELVKSDTSVGLIMLAATFFALFRKNRANALLLLFIIPTILYLCVFNTTFVRYLISVVPAMTILAGYTLSTFFKKLSTKWIIIVVVLALLWPLGKIVLLDIRLCHKDTRRAAEEWFDAHVPSGTLVAYENYVYGPNLFDPNRILRNIPDSDGNMISSLAEKLEVEKEKRTWFRLVNFRERLTEPFFPDSLEDKSIQSFAHNPYLREVYSSRYLLLGELETAGVKYIIISSDNYFRYFNIKAPQNALRPYFNQVRQFYNSIMNQENTNLVAEFVPSFWNTGPSIKIYGLTIDDKR